MCLFNVVKVLSCIKIERREPGWRLSFRSTKYTGAPNPRRKETTADQHASSQPDTNAVLRLVSFILGPLLQAVKLFACSGIRYTKLLAGCYLASFLCDELALNVIWLSAIGRHHRATPSSLVATGLSMLGHSRRRVYELATRQSATSEALDLLRGPAKLAVAVSIATISWFACSLFWVLLTMKPNLSPWINVIYTLFLAPILRLEYGPDLVSVGSTSRRLYQAGTPWRAWMAHVVGTEIVAVGIGMAGLRYMDAWGASNLDPPPTEPVPRVLYPTIVYSVAADLLRDLTGYEILASARPAPVRLWGILFPGVWWLLHFLIALLFYYLIYDPSQTVKPEWTEVLG
ncbi:hypothetical protein PG984_014969 [Apiospora sp. TS-2023a]